MRSMLDVMAASVIPAATCYPSCQAMLSVASNSDLYESSYESQSHLHIDFIVTCRVHLHRP